jgi:glucosamine--fructose-6-phosphate aminotransferase (isomerizing)
MSIRSEIFEQPERIAKLLTSQKKNVEEIAAAILRRRPPFALVAARGTSDNAGRYGNYLLGAMNRLPVALATPSLFTYYQRPPKMNGAVVIGISQSGQSPDILSVIEEGNRQGSLTLAITNSPESPMAKAAAFVLDIGAGPELAVAATKTYTAELAGIAMLSAALQHDSNFWAALARVPNWISEVLKHDDHIAEAASRYASITQCVVLGRGYNYATIFEWALKLKELAYLEAEPYSSADFQHGPIAMISGGFPVMAVVVDGKVANTMTELLQHLRNDLSAELLVISNLDRALAIAGTGIRMPSELPEFLTPLVSIVPAQLLSYRLALAKGYDPENPRTIRKVTETW